MLFDIYGNTIFQNKDIFDLLYSRKIENIDKIIAESDPEVEKLLEYSTLKFKTSDSIDYSQSIEEFDLANQSDWFIPEEYKNLDIEEYCLNKCSTDEERHRVQEEFKEFKQRKMITLLQVLKYVVDTLKSNNIVMGVGRGSSVASYVLYLLDVHKINSLQHNLDWREFLR